jgi:hypothetical protein
MRLPLKPLKAIFPVVVERKVPELCYHFLGTGFFINDKGLFLSAKHIFENFQTIEGDEYVAVELDLSADKGFPHKISNLKSSDQFDIVLGWVENFPDIEPLTLAGENAPMNFDILTVEFSGTHSELLQDRITRALVFNPYFRKGHVVCYYRSSFPEKISTQCLDLSLPALKGASGAPVLTEANGLVIGMITGNVERELLPAQLERVVSDATVQEIKYLLPTGKAISWRHLREFRQSLD